MAASNSTNLNNADWGDVLSNIDPFAFGSMGATFALTLCVIGAAWCVVWMGRLAGLTRPLVPCVPLHGNAGILLLGAEHVVVHSGYGCTARMPRELAARDEL
jgi:hypothetical protein